MVSVDFKPHIYTITIEVTRQCGEQRRARVTPYLVTNRVAIAALLKRASFLGLPRGFSAFRCQLPSQDGVSIYSWFSVFCLIMASVHAAANLSLSLFTRLMRYTV